MGRSWFIHYFLAGKYLQSIIHLGKRLSTAGHKEEIFRISDVSTFLCTGRCRNLGSLTFFLRQAWSCLGAVHPQHRAPPPMGTFLHLRAQSADTAGGCSSSLVELSAEQSSLSSVYAGICVAAPGMEDPWDHWTTCSRSSGVQAVLNIQR